MEEPTLLDRAINYLTVGWAPPVGKTVSVYNLFLNDESVYTGTQTFHTIHGLSADKCYRMTVSAFVREGNGAGPEDATAETSSWTPKSKELRASTRMSAAVSMRGLTSELAVGRDTLERSLLVPANRGACPVGGFADAHYTGGGDGFVTFSGVSDEVSAVGAQAGAVNCQRVACSSRTRLTMPAASPMQGRLRVAVGDVREYHYVERTVRLHATAPSLQFTDPRSPSQMATVPLRGCRAFQGLRKAVDEAMRAKKDAIEADRRLPYGAPIGEEEDERSACWRLECTSSVQEYAFCTASAAQAAQWVARTNEQTHAVALPQRWQTAIKAAITQPVYDNARRGRNEGVWEQAGARDAFVASFLVALPRSGAAPHFPLVFGTARCTALPRDLAAPAMGPQSDKGLLPPRSEGRSTEVDFETAASEGRAADQTWLVSFNDQWDTDLDTLLGRYRGPALPERFSKGLLFQLLWALGTARHAFGLHHNDMLNLRNVKVVLVPSQSAARLERWCYVTNPGAVAMLPLIFRDQAATGQEGSLPGTRRRDRLFELIDAADACRNDPAGTGSSSGSNGGGGGAGQAGVRSGGSNNTSAGTGRARTSWCIQSADTDGLRVVLSNFEVSSLTRVQLDWWKAGFSFPNTAWRDDLQDLAMGLCPRLQGLMLEHSPGMQDLCDRMRAGAYRDRPMMALQHPWFSPFPTVRGVHPSRRQAFVYTPLTVADLPENQEKEAQQAQTRRTEEEAALRKEREGERRAAQEERRRRGADAGADGLLAVLTPPAPWVELNDGTTMTIRWHAHQAHVRPLAPTMPSAPETFGLLQDRISVYSGPAQTYSLPSPVRGECHVFRVAAYYHAMGWTHQSKPLTVGDCSSLMAL